MLLQQNRDAIYHTLAYHSIFGYPLSANEIQKYLIHSGTDVRPISAPVEDRDGRYYLTEYQYSWSNAKQHRSWLLIQQAKTDSKPWLSIIPFIETIAVSGSTAAFNADETSDVDIMIISRPYTGWLTRLLLVSLLTFQRKRVKDHVNPQENRGKYCVNLILEGQSEGLKTRHQDLYTAMEIAHLKVLWNRNRSFQRFLQENSWIEGYLPNFWQQSHREWELNHLSESPENPNRFVQLLNGLVFTLQQWWFNRRHKKNLTLNATWQIDYREKVLIEYQKRIEQSNTT